MSARLREVATMLFASCIVPLFGCDGGVESAGCDPGEVRVCPCGGGRADGAQVCAGDGASFGPCDCAGGGDADADADADVEPDTQCLGRDDFTTCEVVTMPDRAYDICVNQSCVSPGCGDSTCNVPGPHFPPPPDGARNDFLRTEPAAGEPVVFDEATSLEWQGCAAGLRGSGCDDGQVLFLWWKEAVAWCDSLVWAGRDDWRLPDEWELLSIVDFSSSPAIDEVAFPATPVAWFLSFNSSSWLTAESNSVGSPGCVSFHADGGAGFCSEHTTASAPKAIRCVRGAPLPHGPRFERDLADEEHPVVRDLVTGLEWQGCPRGQSGPACEGEAVKGGWAQAVAFCDDLVWAGRDDWRLPGAKESWTIVETRTMTLYHPFDHTVFPHSIPHSANTRFWTLASSADDPSRAWCLLGGRRLVTLEKNPVEPFLEPYTCCVRGGQ